MWIYATLLKHVQSLKAEAASLGNRDLIAAANAFDAKLRKYIDRSTSDSEYYYFATGMRLKPLTQ
jgi:hypothetical protein